MTAPTTPSAVDLGGIHCDLVTRADVERAFDDALAGDRPPLWLASANLDKVTHFSDEATGAFAGGSDNWIITIDGMPMARMARRLTGHEWPRLTGADLLPHLLERAGGRGATVAVLGGEAGTHDEFSSYLARTWPTVTLDMSLVPSVAESTDPEWCADAAAKLAAADFDILIMALSGGRMERWVDRWAAASGCRVVLCYGAAIDFLVGRQRRAPQLVQRVGLEWLWRLASEPRRLARRYLIEGPRAVAALVRHSAVVG